MYYITATSFGLVYLFSALRFLIGRGSISLLQTCCD